MADEKMEKPSKTRYTLDRGLYLDMSEVKLPIHRINDKGTCYLGDGAATGIGRGEVLQRVPVCNAKGEELGEVELVIPSSGFLLVRWDEDSGLDEYIAGKVAEKEEATVQTGPRMNLKALAEQAIKAKAAEAVTMRRKKA